MVAAVIAREERGVVPPTIPERVVVPEPPAIVRALAPLIVELKVIELLLEVIVLEPVRETALENVSGFAPETVMLFPMSIRRPLVNERFPTAVEAPTVFWKAITPPVPPRNVRDPGPLTVEAKVIFAPPTAPFVVLRLLEPVTVTPLVKSMVSPEVMIPASRATEPPPDCAKAPSRLNAPLSCARPLFTRVKEPVPPVVTVLRVKVPPVSAMPGAPSVLRAPNVELVPAVCVMLAAVMVPVEIVAPVEIVKLPRRVIPPTAPLKVTFPVDFGVSVRAKIPSMVDGNEMEPGVPLEVSITEEPVNRTGDAVVIAKDVAVMSSPIMIASTLVFALVMRRSPRGARADPISPPKVTDPVVPARRVSPCVLATAGTMVLEKLMLAPVAVLPLLVVSSEMLAFNVTGPVIPMAPPLVVRLPPRLMAVAPVYVMAPVV